MEFRSQSRTLLFLITNPAAVTSCANQQKMQLLFLYFTNICIVEKATISWRMFVYFQLVLEGEWTLHKGFHYALFTEKVTWNTADAFCKIAFGGQLVKIESVEENSFIKSQYLSGKVDYWIGLSDSVEEGDWNWVDGTNSTGYTNWGNGQPNDSNGQDCAGIRMGTYSNTNYDAQWHDNSCLKTKGFICRK